MDHQNEESIQIKDFNRKIRVNENDLFPIDDIVEETYAITYKNLLEQIKQDTLSEGLEDFKKTIREVISKELLEHEVYVDQMYLKIISKLIDARIESSSTSFHFLFKKIKNSLIESINQSGNKNIQTNKIYTYNTLKRDFELVDLFALIDNLKETFTVKERTSKLQEYTDENFAKQGEILQNLEDNIDKQYVSKKELPKELNTAMNSIETHYAANKNLQFVAFNNAKQTLCKLPGHNYLRGVPDDFTCPDLKPAQDKSYFSYYEFSKTGFMISIAKYNRIELGFPKSLIGSYIYLHLYIHLDKKEDSNTNNNITKEVNIRFVENNHPSQYFTIFFYSGKEHHRTTKLLEGWYQVQKAVVSARTPNPDFPQLLKV
ncbi:DUF685 domain-containing protein (plasmid) [Borrelia miyamotoi]|uniref:DUF685 domain-containing protein n=1 Tax=Borrelia miyamotoi TaxID=47466 RepID=A0AAX3JNP7_9SPIR|nr:DUF685 domain-containing protein [Borrelia miyamotoi]QFP48450.1 DUF685 domain-containing protein [Borrelia miyamotoi]WAZ72348.1 DUF685 domain-containing protein [Borrelia miyamotoi]